jgi:HEAT repeat protein
VLGKLRDKRAVPALMQALAKDSNVAVRAAAAASLGVLGDRKAEDALATAASADSEAGVRNAARKALAAISGGGSSGGGGGGGRFYVAVGRIGNTAGPSAARLVSPAMDYLLRQLRGNSRLTLSPGGASKSFRVSGNITRMSQSANEVTCRIQLVAETGDKRYLGAVSGEATVQTTGGISPGDQRDALENAVKEAHERLVTLLSR